MFVATLDRLSHQPTGFPLNGFNLDVATQRNEPMSVWDQVADHLRNVPGVETVGLADWALLDGYSFKSNAVSINGAPPTEDSAWFMNVAPG